MCREKKRMGRGYGVPQSLVDQEMRRSVVALQASDVRGGAPVAKTSLVHLIIIISTKDICFSFLFLTPGIYNNNNNNMLEWPSPTRLFTLLSWYYFATFAMLIGVVSYSFLAS